MKASIGRFAVAISVLLASASLAGSPAKYKVTNLSSLGGTASEGNSINDLEWVTGFSNLPGDQSTHATLWLYGFKVDLGTLGGDNSNVVFPVKNNVGLISGIAETAELNPLGETWSCRSFFPTRTGHICLGAVWEWGKIRALPTLGGYNGFATGSNDRRQVVGWAENTVHDPTCTAPQVLQFRPVIYGPGRDEIRELPLVPGDTSGAATSINDRGQVVGISGICQRAVGRFSAAHAVLWEKNGHVTEIGNGGSPLGGVAWNTPTAINQWGDVVGFANISAADGDAFNAQAFLWTKEHGVQPLHTLPGDVFSQALGINNWRQVVGISCTAGFASCRGFLWQNGVLTDLNDLVAPGYTDTIVDAQDINDLGRITGQAFNPETGIASTFLAIPNRRHDRDDDDAAPSAARAAGVRPSQSKLPESVRQKLLQRLGLGGIDR